jgi:hypothetical protein
LIRPDELLQSLSGMDIEEIAGRLSKIKFRAKTKPEAVLLTFPQNVYQQ